MLHVGLDLSRRRLDFDLLCEDGSRLENGAVPPDADGLRGLARRVNVFDEPVCAAIESMNGARFVHDRLEELGWQVEIADAQKVKGLAPLACKTDRIDAWVLAELSRRDLVPAIWLPDPAVRGARERARWRLHLVRHRTALKNRIHATLLAFGKPCPVSDLFSCARSTRPGSVVFQLGRVADAESECVIADGPTPRRWIGAAAMAAAWGGFMRAWEDWCVDVDEYCELDDERAHALEHRSARQDERAEDRAEGWRDAFEAPLP